MDRQIKSIQQMTREQILDTLIQDGFEISTFDASEVSKTIQLAARANALEWTDTQVVSTLHNRPLELKRRGRGQPAKSGVLIRVPCRFESQAEYELVISNLTITQRAQALVNAAK